MSQPHCPKCQQLFATSQMNLADGVAICVSCDTQTPLSELTVRNKTPKKSWMFAVRAADRVDINGQWRDMPRGCWVTGQRDDLTLIATTRSMSAVIVYSLLALVWNSVAGLAVIILLAGFYHHLVGPVPNWLSRSTSNGGGLSSLNECFYALIIVTLLMMIGVVICGYALLNFNGDVRFRVQGQVAIVSTGIGRFRRVRKINVNEVHAVYLGLTWLEQEDARQPIIVIKASPGVRFGVLLSPHRMRWFASAVQLLLLEQEGEDGSRKVSELMAQVHRPLGFWVEPED